VLKHVGRRERASKGVCAEYAKNAVEEIAKSEGVRMHPDTFLRHLRALRASGDLVGETIEVNRRGVLDGQPHAHRIVVCVTLVNPLAETFIAKQLGRKQRAGGRARRTEAKRANRRRVINEQLEELAAAQRRQESLDDERWRTRRRVETRGTIEVFTAPISNIVGSCFASLHTANAAEEATCGRAASERSRDVAKLPSPVTRGAARVGFEDGDARLVAVFGEGWDQKVKPRPEV
jgi:hypothetical protein